MFYSIRHVTRFRYSAPVSESLTEVRMQPRSEGGQRCTSFNLLVSPPAHVFGYRDYLGNLVHHFDVPARHSLLTITAEALVEANEPSALPASLPATAWDELATIAASGEHYDWLVPSQYTQPSPLLHELADEIGLARDSDPLTTVHWLTGAIFDRFAYATESTRVDSPIDDALRQRRGVCQDFTHIMLALVRQLGLPGRYVSGYLFHRREEHDRSAADATHAWVEVWLPGLGWVGCDPTNNVIVGARHIRVAVGRDYADVPPTRGIYKGSAESVLEVGVQVTPADAPRVPDTLHPVVTWMASERPARDREWERQQQIQQ